MRELKKDLEHETAQHLIGIHSFGAGSLGLGFTPVEILQYMIADGRILINDTADNFKLAFTCVNLILTQIEIMIMRIGAVVVCWNSNEYINMCLKALCNQSIPFDEIIIIDNGGEKLYLNERLPVKCKYMRLNYNSGFSKANNIALDLLNNCEWVALVNPDAFIEKNWLKKMIEATQANPQFDIFASRLLSAEDPSFIDGEGDIYHISGLAWRYMHGRALSVVNCNGVKEVFSACAAAALYRYNALEAVGRFDEDYFCYFEDVDIGFRLRLAGYRCLQVPQAIAYHVGYASSKGRHSEFAIYYGHRNMVWTYIKNMPGVLFWLFLPVHLIINLSTILWFSLFGKRKVILQSKIDSIKKLSLIWKKRKEIQSLRKASISDILRVMDKGLICVITRTILKTVKE